MYVTNVQLNWIDTIIHLLTVNGIFMLEWQKFFNKINKQFLEFIMSERNEKEKW